MPFSFKQSHSSTLINVTQQAKKSHYNELTQKYKEKLEDKFL